MTARLNLSLNAGFKMACADEGAHRAARAEAMNVATFAVRDFPGPDNIGNVDGEKSISYPKKLSKRLVMERQDSSKVIKRKTFYYLMSFINEVGRKADRNGVKTEDSFTSLSAFPASSKRRLPFDDVSKP